jgi:DNA repair protein RecO
MHAIRTTPGFIIDSRPYGEAGKTLSVFTRDFGLVMATAQGIRLERSKLRYHAQEYSFGIFSLVKGKEFWRLTSASEVFSGIDTDSLAMTARIALLLRRLLRGEEAHPELFDCVESCAVFLANSPGLTDEQMKTLESIVVLRIMDMLGYIGDDKSIDDGLKSSVFSVGLLDGSAGKRAIMNRHINKALRESHL